MDAATAPWSPDGRAQAYAAEFTRRMRLCERLKYAPDLRARVMAHYKNNPADWISDFGITFDPRNQKPVPKLMPFILFPRQRQFIEFLHGCLKDREAGLVEKARDMGASWLCVAFSCWLWLFHPGTAIGFGSLKADAVDKPDDPRAIFPKIRQQIDYLPQWMTPRGFEMGLHATYMKIVNPENLATITGESGDNIGRGGRTTIYFKDESAHYQRPEKIEAALGDNTDVQIDISSVNGTGNVFYKRRMAGAVWEPGGEIVPGKTRVFIFDWRDHPAKTQAWYDQRRARAEAEGLLHILAQEVDRDYSASQDCVIIPSEWVRAAIDAHIKLGIPMQGAKVGAQDVADEGADKNALALRFGVILTHISAWGGEAGEAAKRALPICVSEGIGELWYDCIGVGAGFKAAANAIKHGISIQPWDASANPTSPNGRIIPGDSNSPKNEDFFKNLKAQGWWALRTRFYKTWRAVMFGDVYPFDELISLPSSLAGVHALVTELSQAVYTYNGAGQVLVDKKPDGESSPNMADAVMMCFHPGHRLQGQGFMDYYLAKAKEAEEAKAAKIKNGG